MPMPVSTRSGGKASVMQLCMCRLAGIAFDGTKRASADNAIAVTTAVVMHSNKLVRHRSTRGYVWLKEWNSARGLSDVPAE